MSLTASLPLKGIRVLDFSTLLPGPFATQMLADWGADVVRVESPYREDLVREMSPKIAGQSAAFHTLNRGKRSIALDLSKPEAVALVYQWLSEIDLVVEQFRPGVMARLGLDYETLKQYKPDLIYCSITGYGQTGPYASRAGHDINYLALSGIAHCSGRQSSGPSLAGVQLADLAAGAYPAACSMLAALVQRQQTGEGQYLDIAMLEQARLLQPLFSSPALQGGAQPAAETELLNGGDFYDYYRTSDDRYLSVGSLEPVFRQRLLETLGLDPDRYPDKAELQARFLEHSQQYWIECFAEVDACVEPVLTIDEAFHHPQAKARQALTKNAQGVVQPTAPSFKSFATSPPPVQPETCAAAPLLGEDSRALLAERGYTEQQIDELAQAGVFGVESQR